MRGTLVLIALATVLSASCGGARETRSTSESGPAPRLEGAQLGGPIPGEQAYGNFRDEEGRPVADVHRLLVIGEGDRKSALLLGRRGERPCLAAVPAATENATLDCFEHYENPPLVVKVVAGGENRRGLDWLAVLGLARSPTGSVVLDRQTAPLRAPMTRRSWRGFEWWAFGAMTERGNLGNQFSAFDRDDQPIISLDLGFSYEPPCIQNNEDVCGPNPPLGAWAEARDPVGMQSGAGEEDFDVAFGHPAVRRLLAGKTFFVDGAILWQRCNGSNLGSIVSLRIWPPARFHGEIPILGDMDDEEDVSYREGRAYVEAEHITAVWVSVDHQRRRVVGITLNAPDEALGLDERPMVRITKREIVKEPAPGGGPDDWSQCPEDEPGD